MALERNPFDLPRRIPIFPLSGVILMPFGHVPLHIFEPRYLHLVDDALGARRLIGMIQPREAGTDPVPDDAALFDIGTVGRIIAFNDPGDGRYHITLEGLSRFRVAALHPLDPARGYREVDADFTAFDADLQPTQHDDGPGRDRILELLRSYFTANEIDADWDSVAQAPFDALVSSLCMSCPFTPGERQALLQCETHGDRARMLISLFEMAGDADVPPSSALKH